MPRKLQRPKAKEVKNEIEKLPQTHALFGT